MSFPLQSVCLATLLCGSVAWAGPYSPPAGTEGSDAIPGASHLFVAWADGYTDYQVGTECDLVFQTPWQALGPTTGDIFDIVSLGRGGRITLGFDPPITDGPGPDFAVFENAVTDRFLELAYVEVSSDGTHFARFASDSLTVAPVAAFDELDPSDVDGLAGTFAVGHGTPFDLADLPPTSGLNPNRVRWVRIIDIIGDGSHEDTDGDIIYDPFPTVQSAGFDLEAVGVIHQGIDARFAGAHRDGLQVSFPTGLHRSYQVEFSPDITESNSWDAVGPTFFGDGATHAVLHADPPPGGAYRIRVTLEADP